MNATAITNETMSKSDFQKVQLQAVQNQGGMKLALSSFAELEKFSHFMAVSNFVPKHLRGKQADCLAVLLQSQRWEMDPFSVAQQTYFVNDTMSYMAQLINSVIISRAPIKARPRITWSGAGEDLKCKVSATFIGEDEPLEFEAEMRTITTKNSPLWKQQPKQQLGYYAIRAWSRLYCPDVIMGVYATDEIADARNHYGFDNAKDITPADDIVAELNAKLKPQPTPPHDPVTGEIIEANAEAAESVLEVEVSAENAQAATIEGLKQMRHATPEEANAKAATILALLEQETPKLDIINAISAGFEVTLSKATDAETVAKIREF